ncbi:acetylcholine receptor subunit delta-like [Penaeus japonicus]|uniref:acetylcholine receptor subunit delta-like n=1 Tax=Penaeus japonicus TaxID=27405 RepID=UPI001C712C3D|nr:acetylcholine receptor subunit delta-like [Penaeus japonicus]
MTRRALSPHAQSRAHALRPALGWVVAWVVVGVVAPTCHANPDAKRLYDDLLSSYNRLIRPVQNNTDTITVWMRLRLSQLIDLNLKEQIMTTNVWVDHGLRPSNLEENDKVCSKFGPVIQILQQNCPPISGHITGHLGGQGRRPCGVTNILTLNVVKKSYERNEEVSRRIHNKPRLTKL